jgi:thiamine-phosphate pyrophosphorylase
VILYYITDRRSFDGDEQHCRKCLLAKIAEAAKCGVDFIQLRERNMLPRDLERLAADSMDALRQGIQAGSGKLTRLLINSRTDVALSVGAHGIHLRSHDVSPAVVRAIWADAQHRIPSCHVPPVVAVSCHSEQEVCESAGRGASFVVFAPVLEKKERPAAPAAGLQLLKQACRAPIPVLALGGITVKVAQECRAAGAAGIAAIRLFQENAIGDVMQQLRAAWDSGM